MASKYIISLIALISYLARAKECKNCDMGRGYFANDPIDSDLSIGPQNKFGKTSYSAPIESEFDSRKQWPECDFKIHDLGKCKGADVFQSELASLSFRYCIKGKPIQLSLQSVISCDRQNYGCNGGFLDRSWNYLESDGAVLEECFPFISNTERTPYCPVLNECPNGKKWEIYKCKADSIKRFTDEKKIKQEIIQNGPVMAMFEVREDLMTHKEGIYVCKKDERIQMFFIVFGWGEEGRSKYWLCLSPRGKEHGIDGLIKMRIGGNCPKLAHAMTCNPDI